MHARQSRKNNIAGVAQLVEHDLAKVGVAGSSPVSRSKGPSRPPEGVSGQSRLHDSTTSLLQLGRGKGLSEVGLYPQTPHGGL